MGPTRPGGPSPDRGGMKAVLSKVDRFLQRHPVTAFPVAVFKKFGGTRPGTWRR